jgi:flagellar motor protein MotB
MPLSQRSLLACLCLLGGCQMVSKNQFTAVEQQNRVITEQNRTMASELQNVRLHARKVEDQLVQTEQLLAQVEAQSGIDRRRLVNYRNERDALEQQFHGAAQGSRLPPGVSSRLADLARRYPSLNYDPATGISKLDTDVLFEEGDAQLNSESQKMLREFARILQSPEASELKVMVVGHTDSMQIARRPVREVHPDNWRLSTARSLAVCDFLRQQGLPENKMGLAAFAQHQPLTPNATAADRQRNRRVEIFVTGPETPIVGWTETIPSLY